jgi:hypothetical protein
MYPLNLKVVCFKDFEFMFLVSKRLYKRNKAEFVSNGVLLLRVGVL